MKEGLLGATSRSATTIAGVCERLLRNDTERAAKQLRAELPFSPVSQAKAVLNEKRRMRVFIRDGFIDRYSGDRLVFPGILRLIHKLMYEFELKEAGEAGEPYQPDTLFPFQKNWDMMELPAYPGQELASESMAGGNRHVRGQDSKQSQAFLQVHRSASR